MGPEVRVFGSVQVTIDGLCLGPRDFGGRKPKQLLEILVLSSGRYVAKDRLAHLLWGDDLPHQAAGSLEHYVSLLRRRLAPSGTRSSSVIVTDHGGYRFDATRAWVDLTEFDALYDAAIASSDRPAMERALTLATGELLEDEPYTEWALAARRDTSQRRLQLHVATGELALAEGDNVAAAAHAGNALALDHLNEAAVRLLMTATYRAGEQSRALRVFDEFRQALAADVGADPMPQTRALHQAVLRQAGPVGPPLTLELPPALATAQPPTLPTASAPEHPPTLLPAQAPVSGPPAGPSSLPSQRTRATSKAAPDAAPDPAPPVPLVGRDRELAACLAVHDGPSRGPGLRSVLVDGELGAGKTALLDELARLLGPQRVVRITCTEHSRSVSGWLLEEVLGALVKSDAAAMQALVDGLVGGTAGADRDAALPLATLRRIDVELAGAGPFAVLVDDAHLADERSLQVLAALARRRGDGRGTLVLAADVARLPHGHLLHRSSPDLRLLLEPLSRQQLLALGLSDLHEPTGGLPLLVAACVAARTGQQHKKEHGTQHGREHGKQHSQAVSAEVADRVLRALRSGDERAWRVVVACSVAGERFGTEEVARLAGLAVLEVAEIQERLCRERVLVDAGDGYAFRYPLVRQIVRDTVPAGRRRLLARHLRAGGDRRSTGGTAADGVERRVQGDRRRGTHVDLRSDRAAPVPLPV